MERILQPDPLARARILVRVPNWVGDAVMCLPALRALRGALPEAELVLLAKPWVHDAFPVQELGCRIIAYDTNGTHRGVRGRRRISAALRDERFGAAILFQNAFDAALISWLAGIPVRAGYARQGRRPLLTHPVAVPRKRHRVGHEAYYYLELLRRLGLIPSYSPVEHILLPTSDGARTAARRQLFERFEHETTIAVGRPGTAARIVGLSPGAAFGTAKRWPAARFAELAARLHKDSGVTCVLFGSAQEQALADQVVAAAGIPALSLAGQTSLAEFIHFVAGCDLFITNDTGTMHLAAALGTPTLAIFGPTNENETRPLGARVELVAGEAFCRPCKLRDCPTDHRCMNSVAVERVFRAAQSLLRGASSVPCENSGAAVAAHHAKLPFGEGYPR